MAFTHGRCASGRYSSTLRRLCTWHRCTRAAGPKVWVTAVWSAFAPSRITSRLRSVRSPRLCRFVSRPWHTVVFSVEPSHRPSACFRPVWSMPRATTMQWLPTCTPSISSPTRSRSSSGVTRQASNCAWVCATNRRLTALLLVPRVRTSAPSGSRLRSYWRVATPMSICSTTRRLRGSVCVKASTEGSATSWPSRRTRGRRIPTLRPPSTTSLGACPAREARRVD